MHSLCGTLQLAGRMTAAQLEYQLSPLSDTPVSHSSPLRMSGKTSTATATLSGHVSFGLSRPVIG